MTKFRTVTTLAALAATGSAGLATAQQATKPVATCGFLLKDPKGDSTLGSTDIVGAWLDHAEGKTYLNIQVADLVAQAGAQSVALSFTADYTSPENSYRLYGYETKDGAQAFKLKEFTDIPDPAGGIFTDVGEVPGAFFEGKDGVVQWEIPAEHGGAVGTKLTDIYVSSSDQAVGHPETGGLEYTATSDETDPEKTGEYTVAPCQSGGASGPGDSGTVTTPPPGTGQDPQPTRPPQPTTQPAPGNASPRPGQAGQSKLNVTVSRKVPRARKVRKSLKLSLRSREVVTNIDAALSKGKRVVARGKLGRLDRRGRLKLKVSRRLKKGSYSLLLTGRNANGSTGTLVVKLRFR